MSTSNPKTPHEILGVGRYSTQKEIRRRYLELCKKYHPDVASVSSGVDFTEITTAYEFLSNKRSLQRMQSSPYNTARASASAHQHKPIDTKLWTRRSLIFGLGFAGLLAYSLYDDRKHKPVLSIPRKQHIDTISLVKNDSNDSLNDTTTTNDVNHTPINTTTTATTDTSSTKPPPWQTAGISYREWRKR